MKLYRDNKIANEYEITPQEFADKFFLSREYNDWAEGSGWPLTRHTTKFLTDPEPNGLNSVLDWDNDSQSSHEFNEIVPKLIIDQH